MEGPTGGDRNVYKLSFFCSRGSKQGGMKLEKALENDINR